MEQIVSPTLDKVIKLSNKQAYESWKRITAYESSNYLTWKSACEKNRQFYFGQQYTAEELEANEDKGQYTFTINETRPAINGIVGMLTANSPQYRAVPAGAEDESMAELANKLITWVWSNSKGLSTYRKVVKRAARDNIGWFHMIYSRRDGTIKFIPMAFDDVVVDPRAKDLLFDDADWMYIPKYVPIERVRALYGLENVVTDIPAEWNQFYTSTESTSKIQKLLSGNKDYVKVYEGYHKEYLRLADGTYKIRILCETYLGYMNVYRYYLPDEITHYPLIPVYSEDTENPYVQGEVTFLIEPQRFLNKTHGVALLNAQLHSDPKIFLRENDILDGDFETFSENYAKSGSVSILSSASKENPFLIVGQPLNTAFFQLYMNTQQHFQTLSISKEMLGQMNSDQYTSSSTLLDLRDLSLDKYKDFTANIEEALSRLGVVALQYCRAYLKESRMLKIVDGEKRVERFYINQQKGLNIEDEQSVRAFTQRQQQMGVPSSDIKMMIAAAKDDGNFLKSLTYLYNSVNNIDVDIFVVPGSFAPSYRMAMLRLMLELQRVGAADAELILEYAPIENKEKVLERLSVTRQQAAQLEQMQEEFDRMQQLVNKYQTQIIDDQIQLKVTEAGVQQDKITNTARMQQILNNNRMKQQIRELVSKGDIEMQKILLEVKNEVKSGNKPTDEMEVIANEILGE